MHTISSTGSRRKSPPAGHAVVIGGSIAGLTAARVLTDHFAQVTVVERDLLPDQPAFRAGVPQGRQPHVLLGRGQLILEQLFRGLERDLRDRGAVPVNMGAELRWALFGQLRIAYKSEIVMTACSRPLLEHVIYERLRTDPRLRFLQQHEVVGLATDGSGTAASGIYVRNRQRSDRGAAPVLLPADLVVDASGRDSRAPEWLTSLGFVAPEEITVSSAPGYATRVYRRPSNAPADLKALYVQPAPPDRTRGGIMLPLEGDRWHVCMIGMAGDYPPNDEAGFLEWARSLAHPILYDTIVHAEPLSPILGFRRGENRERRYDQLPRYLERFVVLGDAVYAFNPVYGQGMTVAAMSSLVLGDCLREALDTEDRDDLHGLARQFQSRLAKMAAGAWQLATGEDRRWAALLSGLELDPETRLMQQYMEQVLKASLTVPAVAEAFYLVQQMIEPPTIFFRPDIVLQVVGALPESAPNRSVELSGVV